MVQLSPLLRSAPSSSPAPPQRSACAAAADSLHQTGGLLRRQQPLWVTSHPQTTALWLARFSANATWLGFDSEGLDPDPLSAAPVAMIQLATVHAVLVTTAVTTPGLLRVLTDPTITKVGKALAGDTCAVRRLASANPSLASSAADDDIFSNSWCELTNFLPLFRVSASMDSICLAYLKVPYGWKSVVNHTCQPPPWACLDCLLPHEIEYAAADAAVVPTVLAALVDYGCVACGPADPLETARQPGSKHSAADSHKHLEQLPSRRPRRAPSLPLLPDPPPSSVALPCALFAIDACRGQLSALDVPAAANEAHRQGLYSSTSTTAVQLQSTLDAAGVGALLIRLDTSSIVVLRPSPPTTEPVHFAVIAETYLSSSQTHTHVQAVLIDGPCATPPEGPLSSVASRHTTQPGSARCLVFEEALDVALRHIDAADVLDGVGLPADWSAAGKGKKRPATPGVGLPADSPAAGKKRAATPDLPFKFHSVTGRLFLHPLDSPSFYGGRYISLCMAQKAVVELSSHKNHESLRPGVVSRARAALLDADALQPPGFDHATGVMRTKWMCTPHYLGTFDCRYAAAEALDVFLAQVVDAEASPESAAQATQAMGRARTKQERG